ncbi:putative RNA methylase family protein [Usnea florida]
MLYRPIYASMEIDIKMDNEARVVPPKGCQHFANLSEVPWDIHKYYHQRFSIFSKYDEGIWMTEDAWFGVTPEPVARSIAKHVAEAASENEAILIDCFAGVGGNAIAFALSGRWRRVYAIESDPRALACAKHNAQIYGVQDNISWHEGDCFEILRKELAELGQHSIVFASPPWGGPGYRSDAIFDLAKMQPYNLTDLLLAFQQLTESVVLYLPRTSDIRQLAKKVREGSKITVIHYCMEGASKAVCAYYGSFTFS